jgi:hypothetical protein
MKPVDGVTSVSKVADELLEAFCGGVGDDSENVPAAAAFTVCVTPAVVVLPMKFESPWYDAVTTWSPTDNEDVDNCACPLVSRVPVPSEVAVLVSRNWPVGIEATDERIVRHQRPGHRLALEMTRDRGHDYPDTARRRGLLGAET